MLSWWIFVFMSCLCQTALFPQTHHICCKILRECLSWASCSSNVKKIYTPKLVPFVGYDKLGKHRSKKRSHVSSVLPGVSLDCRSKLVPKCVRGDWFFHGKWNNYFSRALWEIVKGIIEVRILRAIPIVLTPFKYVSMFSSHPTN